MAFKTKKSEGFNYKTPQEMYQDNKLKKIYGPLDYQSDMLSKYIEHENSKNIALELPTGSGKTLIGLLISEFRRRKNKERVLFVCPTNQLVNQVVEQANNKYGIKAISFTGRQKDYAPKDKTDFLTASKIGVTTYSSLFATNSFFDDVHVIVMDDVHSCEDYIISNWSVNIESTDTSFNHIVNLFKDYLSESDYYKLTTEDLTPDTITWCNLLPTKLLLEKLPMIINILTESFSSNKNSNYYAFERIRDNLSECNIFLSNNHILIRPWIAPTFTSPVYQNAKQKILMSATLGRSGELERVTGIPNITRLPIVSDWDKKGLGRKFFTFPDLSLSADSQGDVVEALHNRCQKSVFLVPDNRTASGVREFFKANLPDTTVYDAKSIEDGKMSFVNDENAVVILANRFDGVDFPDDESRLLFVFNLPKTTNIQEKFLISRMGASKLYAERIRTRIIQAVGRCSRNPGDYSIVCIMGDTIQNDLTKNEKLSQFPSELRAELQFGIENSDDYKNVEQILDQANDFLTRNDNWQEAEKYIVEMRDDFWNDDNRQEVEINKMLSASAVKEAEFQRCIWIKDYEKAYIIVSEIISILNAPILNGYKTYWSYIASTVCYELYRLQQSQFKILGIDHLAFASRNNISLLWLPQLQYKLFDSQCDTIDDDYFYKNIENLERSFLKYRNLNKLEKELYEISTNLNSPNGLSFEKGHHKIGELLGYISENPNASGAPDPYWILGDNYIVVSEDKIYEEKEVIKKIPIKDIDEANRHRTWIENNEKRVSKNCTINTVFITNSTELESDARIYCKDLFYVSKNDFISWVEKAMNVLRNAYNTFVQEGSSEWREATHKLFSQNKVTPKDYIEFITSKKLKEL